MKKIIIFLSIIFIKACFAEETCSINDDHNCNDDKKSEENKYAYGGYFSKFFIILF